MTMDCRKGLLFLVGFLVGFPVVPRVALPVQRQVVPPALARPLVLLLPVKNNLQPLPILLVLRNQLLNREQLLHVLQIFY